MMTNHELDALVQKAGVRFDANLGIVGLRELCKLAAVRELDAVADRFEHSAIGPLGPVEVANVLRAMRAAA